MSTCCCACSRCLAGDCCMAPRVWVDWIAAPKMVVTTTTTNIVLRRPVDRDPNRKQSVDK